MLKRLVFCNLSGGWECDRAVLGVLVHFCIHVVVVFPFAAEQVVASVRARGVCGDCVAVFVPGKRSWLAKRAVGLKWLGWMLSASL